MTAVIVTGKTFDRRERLKELGGHWDAIAKNWKFDYATEDEIRQLRLLPGALVTVQDEPTPPAPRSPASDNGDDNFDHADFVERYFNGDFDKPIERVGETTVYGDDDRYLNYFKDKNPISFFGFSSVEKMVQFVEALPEEKRSNDRDAGWRTSRPSWYGTPDMNAAIRLHRDGWRDGVENAARVLDMISTEHALARRRSYSVAGGSVVVGRMLAGNPKHMVRRPKQPGKRVMTLFVENTASGFIDGETLIARAAVVAALADLLERSGYSCEIVSVTIQAMLGNRGPGAQTAVTLKQSGEKLNIEDMIFALGHPSFLRRFNFACVSQANELRGIWESQGVPTSAFNKIHPTARNEFYIKHLTTNVDGNTVEEMARNILPLIKPHNMPLEIET